MSITAEGDDFLVRRRSAGYNSRTYAKHIASAIKLSTSDVSSMKEVVKKVCLECDLKYAEALYPTPTGMVVTDVTWNASAKEEDFHARSTEFIFPLQVGIPGRVWFNQSMEWHPDVSSLPAHVYLRKQIAIDAGLKGCIGLPFQKTSADETKPPVVMAFLFYSDAPLEEESLERIQQVYDEAASVLAQRCGTPSMSRGNSLETLSESEEGSVSDWNEDDDQKELDVVTSLLKLACEAHGIPYAECLRPQPSGMMLSRARFCEGSNEERFYQDSKSFTFPLSVGIPGRVWKKRKIEWHSDVMALPACRFLRRHIALKANLSGCIGVPITVGEEMFVTLFFARRALEMADVEQLLIFLAETIAERCNAEVGEPTVKRGGSSVTFEVERKASKTYEEDEESELSELEWGELAGEVAEMEAAEAAAGDEPQSAGGEVFSRLQSTQSEGSGGEYNGVGAHAADLKSSDAVKLEVKLGEGVTTEVRRALYSSYVVAAKTMKAEFAQDSQELRIFLREAAVMGEFRHPNLLGVLAVLPSAERPMSLLELCECSLEGYVDKRSSPALTGALQKRRAGGYEFELRKVRKWCVGLASALEELEILGLVHRDVKPSNIMVTKNCETVKLGGLGLCEGLNPAYVPGLVAQHFGEDMAELCNVDSHLAESAGAFRFMSPEAWSDAGMGSWSDVYSMALVFWFMATGFHPFEQVSIEELKAGAVHDAQLRPDLQLVATQCVPLATVIGQAWAHDAEARPSAAELKTKLEHIEPPAVLFPVPAAFQIPSAAGWRLPSTT